MLVFLACRRLFWNNLSGPRLWQTLIWSPGFGVNQGVPGSSPGLILRAVWPWEKCQTLALQVPHMWNGNNNRTLPPGLSRGFNEITPENRWELITAEGFSLTWPHRAPSRGWPGHPRHCWTPRGDALVDRYKQPKQYKKTLPTYKGLIDYATATNVITGT